MIPAKRRSVEQSINDPIHAEPFLANDHQNRYGTLEHAEHGPVRD
jgi:hypothetical protein